MWFKVSRGKGGFLVRFQNECENNLSLNQLTVVTAHEILVEEAPKVSKIPEIPEDNFESHKGYYQCVYVLLQFKMEDGIDNKEDQKKSENDPDEEDMDDVNIDDKRERHWRIFFEGNEGGVDEKALLHAKRWDLYLNEKEKLVKGKYSVEVVVHNKKKVLWEVVRDHLALPPHDHQPLPKAHFSYRSPQLPPNTYPSQVFPSR